MPLYWGKTRTFCFLTSGRDRKLKSNIQRQRLLVNTHQFPKNPYGNFELEALPFKALTKLSKLYSFEKGIQSDRFHELSSLSKFQN